MYQRLLNEWLKTEEGATLFNKHKRDIDLLSGFASWLESRPTPRAADLPSDCPNGHGPLFPQDDLLFCDVCKFTVSR